jgi:surface polysaccharide O-acyltransferase-like enzyme
MKTAPSAAVRPMPAASVAQPKGSGRLLFVDNIRVFLTILVILHHLMVIYAGTGSWIYNEGRQDFLTTALGLLFCATNQSFFMGLFLLIGAYFIPGSYDRKGAGQFIKDRLIRLGIPLAVYSWVINPIFIYVLFAKDIAKPFFQFFPGEYFKTNPLIGAGPLWFVEVLLLFSLGYVVWRLLVKSPPAAAPVETRFPGNGVIALFALALGLAGFLVRIPFPMDAYTFAPLNLQFGFFAQYIALFVLGLIAYRRNWLANLPDKTGRLWLGLAVILVIVFIPMMLALGAASDIAPIKGGVHLQSLAYALWESFLCMSMCIGVIYLFRRRLNGRGRILAFLVPLAYTAYLIHAPVITALAVAVRDVSLYPLIKWALVGLVAVPVAFGLSALIRKIPYTDRVL